MPIKNLLLPLAAFVGSAAFLTWRHFAQEPVRQQAALFRETIEAVTTHRSSAKAKAEAAQRDAASGKSQTDPAKPSRASIDLKELANLMAGMRNGTMPDMKAMLKLQKTMLELSPEELSALISEAGRLDLPADQKDGLVMMLIQGLAERDPKAAVMAAAEFAKAAPKAQFNMISFTLKNAFSSWAKKDLAGALTWFDGAVAAGQFENTALSDVNQEQIQMISGVLKPLLDKDPAAARQRLLALTEEERTGVLTGTYEFDKDEASQKKFSDLVRAVLPAEKQTGVLTHLAEQVRGKDNLDGVSQFFSTIGATPEERQTLAAGVVESSLRQRLWGSDTEKPNLESTTKLRTWLAREDAVDGEAALGKNLASTASSGSVYKPADALALVTELHAAQPSDALLISFLEEAAPRSNQEAYQALAGKITDPAARAAALAKLAKP
jgi:hypothetical protein